MYCHIKKYEIKYSDVDFNDTIKMSSLLAFMQESACLSADELGFGYAVLSPRRIGFIIANWYIELYRPIKLGESLSIHTWPVKPGLTIVFRDFEFFVGGEKVGVATSRWCLVNLDDFTLLKSSLVFDRNASYNSIRAVEAPDLKITPVASDCSAYSKVISYSDLDHYNHVNNTKYADLLFDAFSPEELADKSVASFTVHYILQCKAGERVDFYRTENEGRYIVEGRVGSEPRVRMAVTFR